MGTVTSGTGIFSGIDSASIINQLLAIDAQPKTIIQQRIAQLQTQTAAILGINSKLSALRTAVEKFRTANPFDNNAASSSDDKVISATANTSAAAGTYSFLVDRLVSSQQMLSRGFADKGATALGAGTISLISAKSRLDADTALADLNDGAGIARGKIVITDSAGTSATIDLTKAAYVSDVLDAINSNGNAKVTAKVVDDKLVLTDTAGGGSQLKVAESGGTTAASLGILGQASGKITGTSLRNLSANTLLASLNDGRGVNLSNSAGTGRSDLTIAVDRSGVITNVAVNLGEVIKVNETTPSEGAVSTLGQAMKRINDALVAKGLTGVSVALGADGKRLKITDAQGGAISVAEAVGSGTAARDLGLLGLGTGTLNGSRIASGLNTALASSLNGGTGIAGDGHLDFILGDLSSFSVTIDKGATLSEIADQIEAASVQSGNKRVSVTVADNGLGLVVKDLVGGGGGLTIGGTSGADSAVSLGISVGPTTSGIVNGKDLGRAIIGTGTLLTNLVPGKSISAGKLRLTDATGAVQTISYDPAVVKTVGDLMAQINGAGIAVKASINSTGDGLLIKDTAANGTGLSAIKIEDVTGTLAKDLSIAGTASGTGTANQLDGTARKKVTLTATDTLQNLVDKINATGGNVKAAIVQTGSGVTPYQLSLFSSATGREGRFVLDSSSLDLGLKTLDAGENARVFYGGGDLAKSVLLTSSSNTLDNVVSGVKIDLKGTSTTFTNVSVSRDSEGLESSLKGMADAFNAVIDGINAQSGYDSTTKKAGPLLGDATALNLRSQMFNLIQSSPIGVSGKYRSLAQIGFKIGTGGDVTFDTDMFRNAMAEDPASVKALVSARVVDPNSGSSNVNNDPNIKVKDTTGKITYTQLGLAGKIEEFAKGMLDTVNGTLTLRKKTLDDQVTAQNTRIAAIDKQLAAKRTVLQAQFLRMEQAIGQLQQQQSALSGLGKG
ncbi:MAG: flagellar filament capping protein FliD [Planctomycetes bacterium]|nr:flagellar filament capping protein FliD [Planctomycetota bacterium]